VNDAIPHKVNSEQDIDDLMTAIHTQGLDVVEGLVLLPRAAMEQGLEDAAEDIDLDPSPGAQEGITTRCAFTCARWVPRLCSPAKER